MKGDCQLWTNWKCNKHVTFLLVTWVQRDTKLLLLNVMRKWVDGCRLQAFVTVASLTLRSPANARKAVEAGAVDMAALIMGKYPCAAHLQRQGCQMLRNLAVRNPENRQVISLSLSLYLSWAFFSRGQLQHMSVEESIKGFPFHWSFKVLKT